MTPTPPPATSLPHHKLFAYELCLSLVKLVAKTRVADAQLRAQARKSAASAALNCADWICSSSSLTTRAPARHTTPRVRARDLYYLFGLTAGQPTLLQDAEHWLGFRKAPQAGAVSEDFERRHRVVRRLFIGPATVVLDGWEHLRTVLRIQNRIVRGDR